jgi:hypothetical protein
MMNVADDDVLSFAGVEELAVSLAQEIAAARPPSRCAPAVMRLFGSMSSLILEG